jgi:hypothetical protein
MLKTWIKVIDEMVVERGTLQGQYYVATFTSGEVLQQANEVVTPHNHRNVLNMVKWQYPQSSFESIGVNGQGGWTLHMKVRTK